MKHIFIVAFAALAIFGLSFTNNKTLMDKQINSTLIQEETESGLLTYAPTGTFYELTYTKDTIANAANDTLYLPSRLRPVLNDYQVSVSVTRTNISGTTNLAVKVEGSNYAYSGSTPPTAGWAATLNSANAAAAAAATTATTESFFIPHTYDINYRTIIDGTGTQSSSYVIRWVLKRKA